MTAWHVVHCLAREEQRAFANLRQQGFEPYLPVYEARRAHARKVELVRRPLFPRYLFVRFDASTVQWRTINGTFGVHHLICSGDRPIPVSSSVIEAIRSREDDRGVVTLDPASPFVAGQAVRIRYGALSDHVGLFQLMLDWHRVVLLLQLLGRSLSVSVPFDVVEAA